MGLNETSELQQIHEALQRCGQFFAVFGLEFAEQGFFELGPVVGEAVADADAAVGEGDAGGEFGADGLRADQATIDEAGEAGFEIVGRQAEYGGEVGPGGAGAAEFEEDGIVAGFKSALRQGQQEGPVGQLASFDQPVER